MAPPFDGGFPLPGAPHLSAREQMWEFPLVVANGVNDPMTRSPDDPILRLSLRFLPPAPLLRRTR